MKLAVYGTLRRGGDTIRIPGFEMYSNHVYPACIRGNGEITVEVHEVTANDLVHLDRYEGVPHLYTRETVEINGIPTFIYLWAREISPRMPRVVSGDWLKK
jgi:gamma-glutamylcyclotransferase (GGCT)/AIG2-like uncharacterized protein YtfP